MFFLWSTVEWISLYKLYLGTLSPASGKNENFSYINNESIHTWYKKTNGHHFSKEEFRKPNKAKNVPKLIDSPKLAPNFWVSETNQQHSTHVTYFNGNFSGNRLSKSHAHLFPLIYYVNSINTIIISRKQVQRNLNEVIKKLPIQRLVFTQNDEQFNRY